MCLLGRRWFIFQDTTEKKKKTDEATSGVEWHVDYLDIQYDYI